MMRPLFSLPAAGEFGDTSWQAISNQTGLVSLRLSDFSNIDAQLILPSFSIRPGAAAQILIYLAGERNEVEVNIVLSDLNIWSSIQAVRNTDRGLLCRFLKFGMNY